MPTDEEAGFGSPDIATVQAYTAAVERATAAANNYKSAQQQLAASAVDAGVSVDGVNQALGTSAAQSAKMGAAAIALTAWADSVFASGEGARLLSNAFTGFLGKIDEFISGLKTAFGPAFDQANSLFQAYLAPLQAIYGSMIQQAANLLNNTALAQARENVRKNFGDLARVEAKSVLNAYDDMRKSSRSLAGTTLSMSKVFGRGPEGAAAALEYFNQVAFAMGSTFSVLRDEIEKMGDSFLIYQKGLGLTDEQMKAIGTKAIATGRPIEESLKDISRLAVTMGSKFNMSSKLIGRDLGYMMTNVAKFGSLTKTQMATAAVYTRALGLEIKDLEGLVDKFDDFESAATGASKLAQAFGMNVDALRMMKEQDPAKRLDMLRQSFAATGKSIENMSRQERLLLAETSGLDANLVEAALSAKNMGKSYEEIQKEAQKSGKEQKSQAEIMESLSRNIERLVQSMEVSASFISEFITGFMEGISMSLGFKDGLKGIMEGLRIMRELGRQIGEVFGTYFPGIKNLFVSIGETVSNLTNDLKSFTGIIDGAGGGIAEFFANFKNLEGARRSMNLLFGPQSKLINDNTTKSFNKIFESYNTFLASMLNGITAAFPLIAAKGVEFLKSFVKGFMDGSTETGTIGSVGDALGKLFETLNEQWDTVIQPALRDIFNDLKLWFEKESKDPDSFINSIFGGVQAAAGVAATQMIQGITEAVQSPENQQALREAMNTTLANSAPAVGVVNRLFQGEIEVPPAKTAPIQPAAEATAEPPVQGPQQASAASAVADQALNEAKIRAAMRTIKELKQAEEIMLDLQSSGLMTGLWDSIIYEFDNWYSATFSSSLFFQGGGVEVFAAAFAALDPIITTFQKLADMTDRQIEADKIAEYFASMNRTLGLFVEQRNLIIEKNMVETVNAASRDLIEMHNALNTIPEVNVSATIDKLGKKLSLSNEVLKVEKKPLVLNVSLDLTMKAEDITKEIFKTDAKLRKADSNYFADAS